MKLILLNGPKGSGKTTAAKLLQIAWRGEAKVFYLSRLIKEMAHRMQEFEEAPGKFVPWDFYDRHPELKDQPQPVFNGRTPREAYIAVARMMRHLHGEDFFGKMLARRIDGRIDCAIVADVGFESETRALIKALEHNGHACPVNTSLFRIKREMTDDPTRVWVHLNGDVHEHDIDNNGDFSDLLEEFRNVFPHEVR